MSIPNYDPNDIRLEEVGSTCSVCGGPLKMVTGKDPTCTEVGYDFYYVCPEGHKNNYNEKPALGHAEKTEGYVAATCTENGKTARTVCTRCKAVLKESQTIQALGHSWDANGNCTRCSATKQTGSTTIGKPGEAPPDATTTPSEGPGIDVTGETITESIPVTETTATVAATNPTGNEGEGFSLCNPFVCGCWIYLLLALIIGLVVGYVLGTNQKKKKAKKRRPRPYTEVDYAVAPAPAPSAVPMAVTQQSGAAGITAAVHHHVGARKDQQDSYGVSDLNAYATNGVLAIVADGMGGLANGKAVSSNLVHGMLNYFRQTTGQESVPNMMLDMLTQSNDQINRMLQGADRSGSTLVAAVIRGGQMHFLTVGDSRIYLYRHGRLLQLNREHIYQEELALKAVNHIIPLAQVTGDRQAHALTSYLGIGRLTHLDRNYEGITLEPGDRILLATDGVFGTLSQAEMEEALRSTIGEATDIMGEKIRAANMQYQDNNTALVLEFHG